LQSAAESPGERHDDGCGPRRAAREHHETSEFHRQHDVRHELEGRKLGIPGFELAGEAPKAPALHIAVRDYLAQIEALKKPNTHRKYEAVLERFLEFFQGCETITQITGDDLTRFIIALKKDHGLGANTIVHNAVIVAQFFKRQGRSGITRGLQLPERITPLPREYRLEQDVA
jgi:hypothetical protein